MSTTDLSPDVVVVIDGVERDALHILASFEGIIDTSHEVSGWLESNTPQHALEWRPLLDDLFRLVDELGWDRRGDARSEYPVTVTPVLREWFAEQLDKLRGEMDYDEAEAEHARQEGRDMCAEEADEHLVRTRLRLAVCERLAATA